MSKSLLFYVHFVIFFPKPLYALRICELQNLVLLPTVVEACMYCVIEKKQQQQQHLPDIACLVDPRYVEVSTGSF